MVYDTDKDLEEAVAKLEELRANEVVVRIADSRAKYLSDFKSNMDASFEKGYKIGFQQSYLEGVQKGIAKVNLNSNIQVIKALLKKGSKLELIAELLELSINEVEVIIEEYIENERM